MCVSRCVWVGRSVGECVSVRERGHREAITQNLSVCVCVCVCLCVCVCVCVCV